MHPIWKEKIISMATYAMTINERTNQGKALLAYLGTLNLQLRPVSEIEDSAPCRFSKNEMHELLKQSTAEARKGEGTLHEDFKREMASWL